MAKRTEPDVQTDPHRADSRGAGSVGRIAADDAGDAGETGAERRSNGRESMTPQLRGKRIAFMVANAGVEHSELARPWAAVGATGGRPVLVAPQKGRVQCVNTSEGDAEFDADVTTSDAHVEDFDGLVLPGGVANPDKLRTDEPAVAFVRDFAAAGKPIAAICHGPWTLIEADAVRGKTLTSWPSLRTDIRNAGGEWRDVEVFTCRAGSYPLVTSRKPDDLAAFDAAAVELFAA